MTKVRIAGRTTLQPGEQETLVARPMGEGPFRYWWSTRSDADSITVTAGEPGTSQEYSLTVTDVTDGRTLDEHVTVTTEAPVDPGDVDPPIDDETKVCKKKPHLPQCQ